MASELLVDQQARLAAVGEAALPAQARRRAHTSCDTSTQSQDYHTCAAPSCKFVSTTCQHKAMAAAVALAKGSVVQWAAIEDAAGWLAMEAAAAAVATAAEAAVPARARRRARTSCDISMHDAE